MAYEGECSFMHHGKGTVQCIGLVGLHIQLIEQAALFFPVPMTLPEAPNMFHPSPRPYSLFESASSTRIPLPAHTHTHMPARLFVSISFLLSSSCSFQGAPCVKCLPGISCGAPLIGDLSFFFLVIHYTIFSDPLSI